jgi:hypothetical protein
MKVVGNQEEEEDGWQETGAQLRTAAHLLGYEN